MPDLSALFAAPEGALPEPAPGLAFDLQASQPEPQALASGPLSMAELLADLHNYRAELDLQNQVLRYSQAAAEAASQRFETLFASLPLALMVVDAEGQVAQSNALAYDTFRPTEADPPPNFLLPLIDPQHAGRVNACLAAAACDGTSMVSELRFLTGSTGAFTGDLHVARIDDLPEAPVSLICAIVNQEPLLAERLALQQSAAALQQRNAQLHHSQSRLAAIIDSALDAIIGVDAALCINIFNPAAERLFGCSRAQALGSALERWLPAAAARLRQPGRQAALRLGEQQALTWHGQPVPVEVSVSSQPQAGSLPPGAVAAAPGAIGSATDLTLTTLFVRDLSAERQAQVERDALEHQLRESHKMQAVGTMAGGIAHDFNNILAAILGNVELARQDSAPDAAVQTSLDEIERAARRARELVRQILTFSRKQPVKRVAQTLKPVLQDALRLVRVSLPPGITLAETLADDTPPVLADATQVEQAVLNLCQNAIQAVQAARQAEVGAAGRLPQASASVQVSLDCQPLGAALAQRLGLQPGRHVVVRVSDCGTGISSSTVQRIFEPFFTTKPVGQGTGLGLSVVHGVMRGHQGGVDVSSQPGQGSQFALYFPVHEQAGDAPALAPATAAQPKPARAAQLPLSPRPGGSAQTVFYVDDDPALVYLVQRLLGRMGYTVRGYTEAQQALAALRDPSVACDLLVTDYNMPGGSGVDLMRAVLALRPALPVALASGYITPAIENEALAVGARALLHKPNNVQELCDTVRQLLAAPA